MKEGTIVNANDGSYSVRVGKNGLECTGNICLKQKYILIAVNCDLPSDCPKERNNVVMKDLDTGDILFAQERFLMPIHKCYICPKCGKNIE